MHIQSFDSTEEMVEQIRKNREEAHNLLHDSQRALTWGDHWVRFEPLGLHDSLLVEFGRVHTREEVTAAELSTNAVAWEQVVEIIADTEAKQSDGMLYGRAYSPLNSLGELGYTHKAHVWPIEERLFAAASEVYFDYRRITDPAMRLLLEIAYRSFRAHVRSLS